MTLGGRQVQRFAKGARGLAANGAKSMPKLVLASVRQPLRGPSDWQTLKELARKCQ